ncbi:MAG: hypothetical protein U0003_01710 [Vampirovibrionales bacterium]
MLRPIWILKALLVVGLATALTANAPATAHNPHTAYYPYSSSVFAPYTPYQRYASPITGITALTLGHRLPYHSIRYGNSPIEPTWVGPERSAYGHSHHRRCGHSFSPRWNG